MALQLGKGATGGASASPSELADALHTVFLTAAFIVLIGLVASLFLKEVPVKAMPSMGRKKKPEAAVAAEPAAPETTTGSGEPADHGASGHDDGDGGAPTTAPHTPVERRTEQECQAGSRQRQQMRGQRGHRELAQQTGREHQHPVTGPQQRSRIRVARDFSGTFSSVGGTSEKVFAVRARKAATALKGPRASGPRIRAVAS